MTSGAILASLVLVGCSSPNAPGRGFVPAEMPAATSSGPGVGNYIKHVVVIVQENRSFENLFAGYPNADAPTYGYFGKKKIKLHVVHFAPLQNLTHDFGPAIKSWDHGKMDGFNGSYSYLFPTFPYAHLDRAEVKPYWDMAAQYVLADHMFPTEFGPSFTGHLALIAGTTSLSAKRAVANNPIGGPWGCDAAPGTFTYTVDLKRQIHTGGYPCYTQFKTMADVLDGGHVTWRYYAPSYNPGPDFDKGGVLWSSFSAIKSVRRSSDWTTDMAPQTQVLQDAKNGTLPSMSWVIPDWMWSDHTSTGSNLGPSWVSAVVNAIGEGPDWNSTAIIVVWDDWGGWYDNVAPPNYHDYRGPGIRVGCLIVSPYARAGYVSHTVYEFGSILRFAEEAFGLPFIGSASQGYTDARANSLDDSFDFTQPARAFTPISAPYPPSTFVRMKPSNRPPDNDL